MRQVPAGSTDVSVTIRIVDASDGTPETGVEHNTSGIDLWYRRDGEAKVSITEAALSALTDAHSDGGIEHIGDGYYRLDLPDAAVASGADFVTIGGTVTGMVVIGTELQLVEYTSSEVPAAVQNLFVDDSGTAQGGTSGTITLRSGASSVNDFYNGAVVKIQSGTGAGQTRQIIDYAGSTRVATVDTNWITAPDSTSVYIVLGRIV